MKTFLKFLLFITITIIFLFIIIISLFGHILYNKYSYLLKVVRKMENDKYLWPISKKISQGVISATKPTGNTLLIGVGSCSILDFLVKKLDKSAKIDVIDSNKYLLELAQEKHGERCIYINDDFMYHKFDKCYENVISSLPHKEFALVDIDRIFEKYFNISIGKIIYFESKMPHVKNSYVKMVIDNKNKSGSNWNLIIKKNYRNIPPINLCILSKQVSQ